MAIAFVTAAIGISVFLVCIKIDQLRRGLLAEYIGNRDDVAMFILPLLLFVSFNFLLASLAAMLIILIEVSIIFCAIALCRTGAVTHLFVSLPRAAAALQMSFVT
jgi:hypothetical protein